MKTLYITKEQMHYLNCKPQVAVILSDNASIVVNASGTIVLVSGETGFNAGENVNMVVLS